MQIVADAGQLARLYFGFLAQDAEAFHAAKDHDSVDLSQEALEKYKQSVVERMKNGTYTLGVLQDRVNDIYQEIDDVWNSALPDRVKFREIDAKETEISLLQAGQFRFLKAISTRAAV